MRTCCSNITKTNSLNNLDFGKSESSGELILLSEMLLELRDMRSRAILFSIAAVITLTGMWLTWVELSPTHRTAWETCALLPVFSAMVVSYIRSCSRKVLAEETSALSGRLSLSHIEVERCKTFR